MIIKFFMVNDDLCLLCLTLSYDMFSGTHTNNQNSVTPPQGNPIFHPAGLGEYCGSAAMETTSPPSPWCHTPQSAGSYSESSSGCDSTTPSPSGRSGENLRYLSGKREYHEP